MGKNKSNQHTLAPWYVMKPGDSRSPWLDRIEGAIGIASAPAGWGLTVAAIPACNLLAERDARLMAAAPDMLDALQTAFFAMGRAGANASLDHSLREAWEAARAAIAKATGGQP